MYISRSSSGVSALKFEKNTDQLEVQISGWTITIRSLCHYSSNLSRYCTTPIDPRSSRVRRPVEGAAWASRCLRYILSTKRGHRSLGRESSLVLPVLFPPSITGTGTMCDEKRRQVSRRQNSVGKQTPICQYRSKADTSRSISVVRSEASLGYLGAQWRRKDILSWFLVHVSPRCPFRPW